MRFLLCLLVVIALSSCSGKVEEVERSFYFWQSNRYSLSDAEDSLMANNNIKKLYVKFFEVEHHPVMGNVPFSKTSLNLQNNRLDSLEIIPTVYIKNEVFKNSSNEDLDVLADNINFLIEKYANREGSALKIDEYQMDCDWTKSTKDKYFYFLKSLKRQSQKQISCTLRLYPYKYPEIMGTPPVDRATLMCYNLLPPLENKNVNSILDQEILKSYLNSHDYPLHLDVALPVYSMMQLYQNGKFSGIIYDTQQLLPVLKQKDKLWYEATEDIVVGQNFIRKGDQIKYEQVDADQIEQAISIIKRRTNLDKKITVTLFHLDGQQLKQYSNEEINRFFTGFID